MLGAWEAPMLLNGSQHSTNFGDVIQKATFTFL